MERIHNIVGKMRGKFHSQLSPHIRMSLLLGSVIPLITACSGLFGQPDYASPGTKTSSLNLLEDEFFTSEGPMQAASLDGFMHLPADIRLHLDQSIVPIDTEEQRFKALRNWAFDEFQGDYEYDPSFTSSLSEILDNKRINCFSFSNLFVAAARYTSVPANFQVVHTPPQWDIENGIWIFNQHINVTGTVVRKLTRSERKRLRAAKRQTGTRVQRVRSPDLRRVYVVDFNPEIAADSYRSEVIEDQQALSLYYSNKTAEALIAEDVDSAREFAWQAILADQESTVAWNNMGVLFSRVGRLEQAKEAYLVALSVDPGFESAAHNLESIYRRQGEVDRADEIAWRIRAHRIKNPYYHYSMGESMLREGNLKLAAKYFKDAIKRKDDEKLFYFSLAETQYKLGKYNQASKNLKAAKMHSTPREILRYNQLNYQLESVEGEGLAHPDI